MDIEYVGDDAEPTRLNLKRIQRQCGPEIARGYQKVIGWIRQAKDRHDLEALKSLRLHPLKGDRSGQWAMNPVPQTKYRVIVEFEPLMQGERVRVLGLVDYHSG